MDLKKRGIFIKKDTRRKRELFKRQQINELETKRDYLVDHGFLNRAKMLENQIRALKREVDNISRS